MSEEYICAVYSWPARYVAASASTVYKNNVSEAVNLQYENPPGHLKLMTKIGDSNQRVFVQDFSSSVQ